MDASQLLLCEIDTALAAGARTDGNVLNVRDWSLQAPASPRASLVSLQG
jgi:hypothetical protein